MFSSVLRSQSAVEVNIAIMRTFVQLRRLMDSNLDLARRIEATTDRAPLDALVQTRTPNCRPLPRKPHARCSGIRSIRTAPMKIGCRLRVIRVWLSTSNKLQLFAYSGYLNEMISHRNAALTYAREAGLDFEALVHSDAMYHGPANINVYLGAYVSALENGQPSGFDAFLNRVAPYTTESELRRWIDKQGLVVIESQKNAAYLKLYGLLEKSNTCVEAIE